MFGTFGKNGRLNYFAVSKGLNKLGSFLLWFCLGAVKSSVFLVCYNYKEIRELAIGS